MSLPEIELAWKQSFAFEPSADPIGYYLEYLDGLEFRLGEAERSRHMPGATREDYLRVLGWASHPRRDRCVEALPLVLNMIRNHRTPPYSPEVLLNEHASLELIPVANRIDQGYFGRMRAWIDRVESFLSIGHDPRAALPSVAAARAALAAVVGSSENLQSIVRSCEEHPERNRALVSYPGGSIDSQRLTAGWQEEVEKAYRYWTLCCQRALLLIPHAARWTDDAATPAASRWTAQAEADVRQLMDSAHQQRVRNFIRGINRWPFDPQFDPMVESLRRRESEVASVRQTDAGPALRAQSADGPRPRLVPDKNNSSFWLDGDHIPLMPDQFAVVGWIIEHKGQWASGSKCKLVARADRVVGRLPEKLRAIIETKAGPGGGYRIDPKLLA